MVFRNPIEKLRMKHASFNASPVGTGEAGHRREIDEMEFHRRLGSFQPYVLAHPKVERKSKRPAHVRLAASKPFDQ